MKIEWPVTKPDKWQYIYVQKDTMPILLKNRNYVILRRFSSKDDSSRLIAAPYFFNKSYGEYIGIENKLNYIYRKNGELEKDETIGLSAILNSELFDCYFRTFNGNINVSATELKEMQFPPMEQIEEIGRRLIEMNDYSEMAINMVVREVLKLNL